MGSKKEIVSKIRIVLTNHFETPEKAFSFFDKNSDGALSKKEIVKLLKQAEISGYDFSNDNKVDWKEFRNALKEMS